MSLTFKQYKAQGTRFKETYWLTAQSPGFRTNPDNEDWTLRCPRTRERLETVKMCSAPNECDVLEMLADIERVNRATAHTCTIGADEILVHHPRFDDILIITRGG
jgi:hypothetical protein